MSLIFNIMNVNQTDMDTQLIYINSYKVTWHIWILPLLSHILLAYVSLFLLLRTCSRWPKEHIIIPVVLHFHQLFGATVEPLKLLKLRKQERYKSGVGHTITCTFFSCSWLQWLRTLFLFCLNASLKFTNSSQAIVLADFVQSHLETLAFLSGKGRNFHLFQKLPQCIVLQVQQE